jgi:hypothetical protein
MYQDFLYSTVFDKMNWPGNETHVKSTTRYEVNRSEEYEHDSRFRNRSLNLRSPEGVSAIARNIEDILNPGWDIPPPHFGSVQLSPPAMGVNGAYLPPTEGLLQAMQAELRVTQQAEAARTLRENQSRGLLMAGATATTFTGQVPGRFNGATFQYQGMPHSPWPPLTSTAYATMVPSVPSDSTIFHPSNIAAAPYQSLPPPEVAFPLHEVGDAAAARALVEDKIRYSTTEAGPREKRRQRSRVNDPFPVKLLRLLSEVESNGNEHVVSFTPSGLAFQVHKPNEFMQDVAPKYFRQKKFSSFTRQLNMYGFEKVNHGPDKGSFSHADFQRGKPELCTRILARIPEDYRSARAL